MSVRVLLVDDHPVVRDGLRAVLEGAGFVVAGEAEDGRRALAVYPSANPDVVLMDLRMPVMDGVTATTKLRELDPAARVLVLTTYDRDGDIARAMQAGASGYLLKDAPRDELHRAVRAAARGEVVLAPAVAARVWRGDGEELSAREREVLQLVAKGCTNREVGERLHVSAATVKTHLLNVYAKLGVDDRTAAVVTALERGLIEL
ncbi:response regulator transcription factor [Solirubrobacter sp. CPCC 204708]|uniref:Response regulator transcription factor n=1 Tax=Solirubrobacter deserti TaxID=2282478 RepID=A0ABT4RL95_9ACTN|nr:response regulator transcription factor [Solirubrobacter deserti]MBE2318941.1 response regulator transcription factor [Solirubrobacter deserti]MDA0139334.1 response regulator transcription factor [Solirubrobacter deserti]